MVKPGAALRELAAGAARRDGTPGHGCAAQEGAGTRLRACMDELPACKDLIKRFGTNAHGLLECQKILKTKGLCHDTLAQCQPLTYEIPSASLRQEFEAYLEYQLATAQTYDGQTISALAPSHYADLNDGACYKDARVEVEAFM